MSNAQTINNIIINEDKLCSIFAERVRSDPIFKSWLLRYTKFSDDAERAELLFEEQSKRPAKAWWRHWWCFVRETGRQSETDIFLVFSTGDSRFALHIENKWTAPLALWQAADYAPRARQMSSNKWVPYSDFETLIIAPQIYLSNNIAECEKFDRSISYETISDHLKEFLL